MFETDLPEDIYLIQEVIIISRQSVDYLEIEFKLLTEEGRTEVFIFTTFLSLIVLKNKLSKDDWEQFHHDICQCQIIALQKFKANLDDHSTVQFFEERFYEFLPEIMTVIQEPDRSFPEKPYYLFYENPLTEKIVIKSPNLIEIDRFSNIFINMTKKAIKKLESINIKSNKIDSPQFIKAKREHTSDKQIVNKEDFYSGFKKYQTSLKIKKEINLLRESERILRNNSPSLKLPKKQPEFINSDNIPDGSAVHKKPVKKTEPVNRKSIGLELFMFFFVATCIFGFLFFKEIKGFFQQTFIGETLETAETTDPIDPLQSFNWIGSPGKQTHFRNGDAIIEVWSKPEWDSLCRSKVPAFCHVENNRDNDEMYGLLYNWWAISDPRNICPEGCHLPTKEDLLSLDSNTLFNQNRSELLTHFPGYKNENGYFKGKEELLTVWFNQIRYTGCYEACIVSNDNMKFDCYAANNAYSILFIPD